MNNIIIYGIGDAGYQYRVLQYHYFYEDNISTSYIKCKARFMQMANPSIEHVYMLTNRPGLKRKYIESLKKNTIESCAVFKDILEREGIRLF